MANDITNFCIDQAATFSRLMYLGCEPKTAFGDPDRQETTKDGLGKFVVQLAGQFHQFGRAVNTLLNVGIAAESDPCTAIAPGTPVELVGFEIGVMEKVRRDKESGKDQVVGVQVWYRCREIRPLSATGSTSKRGQHSEPVAS